MIEELDTDTKLWIRDESDRIAVKNGCRFDRERGEFAVKWIESNCYLYEGVAPNTRMTLDDWQKDFVMRLFGWIRPTTPDEKWHTRPTGFRNYPVGWLRRFTHAVVFIAKKNGKALKLDEPIPTPTGWTTVGDSKVGDEVFAPDGSPTKIVYKTEVFAGRPCFRVTTSNGASVIVDEGHLWETNKLYGGLGVRTTREIYNTLRRPDGAARHSMPMPLPIQCTEKPLPFNPYVFGLWLGDGDSDLARITTDTRDYHFFKNEIEARGITVRNFVRDRRSEYGCRYQIGEKTEIRPLLKSMGVFRNKRIPAEYLRASERQRIELLQGLMDTDGFIDKSGKCLVFTTASQSLARDVGELLSSLGVKYSIKEKKSVKAFNVQFHAFYEQIQCFKLPRKLNRQRHKKENVMRGRSQTIQIVSVEPVESVPVQCIAVDHPSHQFLVTDKMIPTHNTPTLAAIGLYLLCGDGEHGQKIYTAAKDGKQAMLAQTHAIRMADASPKLRRPETKINQSTKRITHPRTFSFMDVVAGDNKRSQEGLNGSVLVDEIHVVDAELMSILEGAGISRAEPLHVEVSTAGNNVTGYGKTRFDKALAVAAGTEIDQGFLSIIYAAPQDLNFEQLDADPIKYGKMANPAWGRLVHEKEFMAHYQRSKRSISDMLNFMMYRLNIWQRSSNPWLKMGDWSKCFEDFTDEDLKQCECRGAALDMSRVADMAALALIFRHPNIEGAVRAKVYLFWPEEVAREHRHEAPFLEWARDGHLILTPGNTMDVSFVRSFIIERHRETPFPKLAYDEWNADGLTQELAEGAKDHHGHAITEGLGIERVPFPQSIKNFSQPTDLFESMVIEGKFRHNGNPCLTWQAGHVQVARDTNGNKRPMKPDGKRESIKKIDGIIAAVMALAIYQVPAPSEPSIFVM